MGAEMVAVVLATTPAAGLTCAGGSVLGRLTEQLDGLAVREIHIVARVDELLPGMADPSRAVSASGGLAEDLRSVAKIARTSACPVAVLAGDVVAHTEALAALIRSPSRSTSALVALGGEPGPLRPPVRTERGRIVAAGNSFHQVESPNATFLGVLLVGEAHLAGLAEVAEELAGLAHGAGLGRADDTEVADLLLAGLVRAGVPVQAAAIGDLHCERVTGRLAADAAVRGLSEVDENQARLDAAVKRNDGFFTTYCVSSWSRHLVRLAARLSLTPNAVTGLSVALAGIAAIWFSAGDRTAQLIGAVALYLSFVLDCVDGQLARYTRRFSPLGAWLDATSDRVKEYVVYVGLAIGYAAGSGGGPMGPNGIWALVIAAMILQSIRHMVDFSYGAALTDAAGIGTAWASRRRPLSVAQDAVRTENAVVEMSRKLDRGVVTHWLKKVFVLPIGERMALIAITAALFNARVTFLALLAWGGLALVYTVTGRIARSLA